MCNNEKKTQPIRVHVGESLEVALHRLAAADERSLSDYIERVLRFHVCGHGGSVAPGAENE